MSELLSPTDREGRLSSPEYCSSDVDSPKQLKVLAEHTQSQVGTRRNIELGVREGIHSQEEYTALH